MEKEAHEEKKRNKARVAVFFCAMDTLPDEVLALVFGALPCAAVRSRAGAVCWRWRRVALDPAAVGRSPCVGTKKARRDLWCTYAARAGHLDCLCYLRALGCRWREEICVAAAAGGHLACLVYAHENGCPWYAGACSAAAEHGRLDCLRYLHENGCPWDAKTCEQAAGRGHLDCLVYAHENGCPWDGRTSVSAAKNGHVACVAFALDHGCPDGGVCQHAAYEGKIDVLVWAHQHGVGWDAMTCQWAAEAGSLECLRYAHEHGCPWNGRVCYVASRMGQPDCLAYACENDCPYNGDECIEGALALGATDVVLYVIGRGHPWSTRVLAVAARCGNLDVLRAAHADGFTDTSGNVCREAGACGRYDALAFAHQHEWAWGGQHTCDQSIESHNAQVIEYVREHGCHCNAWQRRFAPARRRRLVSRNAPGRNK